MQRAYRATMPPVRHGDAQDVPPRVRLVAKRRSFPEPRARRARRRSPSDRSQIDPAGCHGRLPGFTRLLVLANGLHFATDRITQRVFTVGIQKDAQAGSDGCPSPSIIVTPPNSGVSGTECSGSTPGTFTITGTGPFTFPVTIMDVNGNPVAGGSVGAPVLAASGGGSVASVAAVQNPFQLKVTPTGSSGSAGVTVTVTSAHPGDGVIDSSISFTITAP